VVNGPILFTERCRIEPFDVDRHLSARYVGWLNDPQVVRFSEQRHRRHDEESCKSYANSFIGTPHYFWAIVARDEKLGHIGNISAHIDISNSVGDIGIMVGERSVWGRGYGSEAWSIVAAFLFDALNLRKVTAGMIATNKSMIDLAKRTGMTEDGYRRRQFLWEGQEVDMLFMALFRPEKD
jgi:[ribosomal protein S5]-alanine N-acetyltransferase